MKTGIMGGTFNPFHNGHLMLGEYAYRQFFLDEVWFMPNGNPPHKQSREVLEDMEHRLEMTRLAIEDIPYFRLCTCEAERKEPSYSWETMRYLKERYPDRKFYFILGADSLFSIEPWRHPEPLISELSILAAYRDDKNTPESMNRQISRLNRKYHGDIRLLQTPVLPVSSHEIREGIRNGNLAAGQVPQKVADYIQKHHLYRGE